MPRSHVSLLRGRPGEENLDFLESLRTSSLKLITTRHEASATFMAATYGRLTGKVGAGVVAGRKLTCHTLHPDCAAIGGTDDAGSRCNQHLHWPCICPVGWHAIADHYGTSLSGCARCGAFHGSRRAFHAGAKANPAFQAGGFPGLEHHRALCPHYQVHQGNRRLGKDPVPRAGGFSHCSGAAPRCVTLARAS